MEKKKSDQVSKCMLLHQENYKPQPGFIQRVAHEEELSHGKVHIECFHHQLIFSENSLSETYKPFIMFMYMEKS